MEVPVTVVTHIEGQEKKATFSHLTSRELEMKKLGQLSLG